MDKKNVAVVGCGYWGKNLVRNFHELGVLAAICDSTPKTLEEFRQKYSGLSAVSDFSALLNDPLITAIAIAAPAVAHYELAKKALTAGKDVFVEKPLALTVDEAEELIAIAAKNNRIIMVGHILRYHPALIKLKELINQGDLGKIQYIYSNRLNIGKLRTEENILWSFAPHDISAILWLVGEEPVKVFASGGDYLNRGIYDTTLTALEFHNGVKGHIFVSWLHPFKEQKLVVVGSKNMAVFDDMTKEKLFMYPHTIEWHDGKVPVARKADCQAVAVDSLEPLKEELRHFVDCVNSRKNPHTDGAEGLMVLRILEDLEASLRP